VVIVPIEAASLAGALGGIAELTRSVFGEGASAARAASRSLPPATGASPNGPA
jgi:hypothetical protein